MEPHPLEDNPLTDSYLSSALRTISVETRGLESLERAFNSDLAQPFTDAVQLIRRATGRVIVTGVGKSGHIGCKIAATLASTGTPAFFVHPAEANHGDLGMIAADDVIVALSWSGESAELSGVVNYARRFGIPLIAITAGVHSTLAREASVVLCLPTAAEACPHGLAPTTSTLMQLVTGDAIAVALLESRGFTPSHFRTFHPGGKLGATLTVVGDIMHRGSRLPIVSLGTSMPEAALELSRKRFGCVCIVDEVGKLAGIITDGDLARNLHRDMNKLTVDKLMTRSPRVVTSDILAAQAMGLLNEHNISALVVVENNIPIGIVHFHDLLQIGVR